jgi:hypothetical protein
MRSAKSPSCRLARRGTLFLSILLVAAGATAATPDVNEPNDTASTATTIACGASYTDLSIDSGDVDLFSLTVDEPLAVGFDIDGHDLAHTRDLVLVLRDENGETLAEDDDGLGPDDRSAALDPYLEPRLLQPGTYTLGVAGYEDFALAGTSTESGPYSLHVSCARSYGCEGDESTVCIDRSEGDRRFAVSVRYETALGGGSSGDAGGTELAPLGIGQGAVFHFFDPANPEILLKILDGCPTNRHVWVFFAATTNVGFEITVRDLKTGAVKTYRNPDRNAASTVLDTKAFGDCSP